MQGKIILAAVGLAMLPAAAMGDRVPPFEGNDTGGIIAWSPEAHRYRHTIAGDHCARYHKLHRITSVHAWYGAYIGFECYWPRGYEPHGLIVRYGY